MNKRIVLLSLTFPLIASCHGGFISKEDAKIRIDHLNELLDDTESASYIKPEDYDLPNFLLKRKYQDDVVYRESMETLNVSVKYYHKYQFSVVKNGDAEERSILEYWDYYSLEDDKHIIYHVSRENGKVSDSGNPVYKVVRDIYKEAENCEKSWNETIINTLRGENRALTLKSLQKTNEIYEKIVEDNGIAVSYFFNSLNENSVYVNAHYTENEVKHTYEISIENYHMNQYLHYVSDNDYDDIKIDYGGRVDKLEPNITNEESHPYTDNYKDYTPE